jgi:hypothetical protein
MSLPAGDPHYCGPALNLGIGWSRLHDPISPQTLVPQLMPLWMCAGLEEAGLTTPIIADGGVKTGDLVKALAAGPIQS